MNCDERYFEMMNRLIDGELDAEETAQLNAHLAGCSECSDLYEALKIMAEEAGNIEEEAPEGLTARIMDGVRKSTVRKKNRPVYIIRWAVSIASAAALFVTVIFAARVIFSGAKSADPAAMDSSAGAQLSMSTEEECDKVSGENGAPAPSTAPMMPETEPSTAEGADEPRDGSDSMLYKYSVEDSEYRFVLVLSTLPDTLSEEDWEAADDGSRRYVVDNELALSLQTYSEELYDTGNFAEQSLIIVFYP